MKFCFSFLSSWKIFSGLSFLSPCVLDVFKKRTDALDCCGNTFENLADTALFAADPHNKTVCHIFAHYAAAHADEITEGSLESDCLSKTCRNNGCEKLIESLAVLCVAAAFEGVADAELSVRIIC